MQTFQLVEQARPTGEALYAGLESRNWAPWLRFGADELSAQAKVYPDGQIVLATEQATPAIMLAANRIEWDGTRDSLPTWDEVAGSDQTFEQSHKGSGNTFVLMSMSANKEFAGERLSDRVFDRVRSYAQKESLDHIIGDFRPSDFGAYKARTGDFDFERYCNREREDGLPDDGWLRAVRRQGANFIKADRRAMVIESTFDEVSAWSWEHNPAQWWEVTEPDQVEQLMKWHEPLRDLEQIDQIWECGEAGTWYCDTQNNKAVYIESNLWGEIPVKQEEREGLIDQKYQYDLSGEELVRREKELVEAIKVWHPAPDVYAAWVAPNHRFANVIRTLEKGPFPEIPNLVNDRIEEESLFYVLVDTREGRDRIIHGARLSGLSLDKWDADAHINMQVPGFVVVEELIGNGQITQDEFQGYCRERGIDPKKSFSVETNFRVGTKVPDWHGVRIADIAYMNFNRILGESGADTDGAVFAAINRASRISFSYSGIEFDPVPVRPDPEGRDHKYDLVSLPFSPAMERLTISLGDLAAIHALKFA